MSNKETKKPVITPVGTLVFSRNLFEPTEEGKYKAAIVIEGSKDLSDIQRICKEAVEEKWTKGKPSGLRMPVKKETREDMIEKYPFMEGNFLINAATKFPVQVLDRNLDELFKSDIKDGDKVRFSVTAFAYESNGNKGIGLNLMGVQKIEDGEALFKKSSARDYFGKVEVEAGFSNKQEQEDEYSFS